MKKTTAERDPQAVATLREMIEAVSVAMVTTVTPEGALRSRPMITAEVHEEGELWFFLADNSGQASDLEAEHAVNVNYADPRNERYVSVTGNATLVHDQDKLSEAWDAKFERYFPRGLDEPHLAMLRVDIETAEYWRGGAEKSVLLPPSIEGNSASSGESDGVAEHTRVDIRKTPTSG